MYVMIAATMTTAKASMTESMVVSSGRRRRFPAADSVTERAQLDAVTRRAERAEQDEQVVSMVRLALALA